MRTIKQTLFPVALLLVCASLIIIACSAFDSVKGADTITSETRTVANFHKMEMSGGYDVVLTQSATTSVRVEAPANVLESISTEVKDGTLYIKKNTNTSKGTKCVNTSKSIKVYVSTASLDALKASGAVSVKGTNKFSSERFELTLSGAGEVDMELDTKLMNTKVSGAGELKIRGKADTHGLRISGAGEVNAFDFEVDKYALELSGASECNIFVKSQLAVVASGASEVNYKGSPAQKDVKTTGASEINKVN